MCFPHAGGAAVAFTALSAALPADIEVVAVQYPGRQDRRAEPFADDITTLAAGAVEALAGAGCDDRPLFLLGHSLGSLVAFEAARLLERRGDLGQRGGLERLFASAAWPPSADWKAGTPEDSGDDVIVEHVRWLGGVPEALLDDPGTVAEMVRLMRGDNEALGNYRCAEGAAVAAPLTVLLAEDDPKNTAEQMTGWARHTRGAYALEPLPGGHFALTERDSGAAPLLTRYIREDLKKAATAPDPVTAAQASAPAQAAPTAPRAPRAELVREIYLAGIAGERPRLSTDLTTLKDAARAVMEPRAHAYVAGDAGTGATGRANREAFDQWRLLPRMWKGGGERDLSVSLLGRRLDVPVLLAPVAAQTVAHPEGELASARAAAEVGVPFVLSSFSSHSLEDVAQAAEAAGAADSQPRWYQLYWPNDPAVAESLVRRVAAAGYTAIVVTVDNPTFGYRPSDLDTAYLPFVHGEGIANFTSDPVFRSQLPEEAGEMATVAHWAKIASNPTLTWDDLPRLRRWTDLPLLIKGIQHPDDAHRALAAGADGVVVSNHGGRQLDGGVAALDALPAVRAAVGPHVPVLMDSGIRTGTDIVKALALGADAVLYGRPYVYGLALNGQAGAAHALRCLLADLDLAMTLTGCPSVADITRELVVLRGPLPEDRPVRASRR
ncbi:putative Lactate 2-monooxygenase [Streptomyces aurantiacus JA 4570]|uniref:Putative Lactate 2-monooxygenase n=1 Tax=Streptomyces aurantiacus JA 4570 TaxID=1286094 RepID=S3Z7X5_9ACTN|nr:putative Lactate 2-monooxygenase [Streptomyces aurantiacus JA 4570]